MSLCFLSYLSFNGMQQSLFRISNHVWWLLGESAGWRINSLDLTHLLSCTCCDWKIFHPKFLGYDRAEYFPERKQPRVVTVTNATLDMWPIKWRKVHRLQKLHNGKAVLVIKPSVHMCKYLHLVIMLHGLSTTNYRQSGTVIEAEMCLLAPRRKVIQTHSGVSLTQTSYATSRWWVLCVIVSDVHAVMWWIFWFFGCCVLKRSQRTGLYSLHCCQCCQLCFSTAGSKSVLVAVLRTFSV